MVVQRFTGGVAKALAAAHQFTLGSSHSVCFADLRSTFETAGTTTTTGAKLEDDVIVGPDVTHTDADLYDFARALVTCYPIG